MSDPTEQPTGPKAPTPVDVAVRRHAWEAYSVIVATIVGLLSLAVSAYTAYTLHVQTRAQVFPYLQMIDLGEQHRVAVHNKGVGPAFVRSLRVAVDGRPVADWRAFFAAARIPVQKFAYSNLNHVPIAANETLPALVFLNAADFDAYTAIDQKRVAIDLCYCSVLDECWNLATNGDGAADPAPVRSCRVDPATDFQQ